MNLIFKDGALRDLKKQDRKLQKQFLDHSEKMKIHPSKKHFKFGVPFFVEKITKQARFIFNIENDTIYILRCFKTHKEYEDYYKRFRWVFILFLIFLFYAKNKR